MHDADNINAQMIRQPVMPHTLAQFRLRSRAILDSYAQYPCAF
jgi:hypothetical protein